VIPIELAVRLREAGLRWTPAPGDAFIARDRDMDDEVFVLSDMTIQVYDLPGGSIIGFNGTTEWALDDLDKDEVIWLPREDQLRDHLGASFDRLERAGTGYRVVAHFDGAAGAVFWGRRPEEAYAHALLHMLTLTQQAA
jgi:hypothetical protein